ncbi:GTPase IMAP family member 8-like [Brachionichthys hirsutus]|uniref:GTPase IMAP family member 8-like n=1 Tax=Brachionichthys hirsutus TaxID=412623 RepID=UPI0036048521
MSAHVGGSYYASSNSDLRLILLGNIGCGKTSSANTILDQQAPIPPSDSRSCQLRQGFSDGRNVTLVEAPRWYWAGGKMVDSVRKETEQAKTLLAPGPHAILLLVPIGLFTEMEAHVPEELEKVFGKEVLNHTLVLLTCGDYLMGRTAEQYLREEHSGLRQIIDNCGGRYHVINNRQQQNREQVRGLLDEVDTMVKKNGAYFMKTAQEREVEKRTKELMEEYRARQKEMKETFTITNIQNTESQRSFRSVEDYSRPLERRRGEGRDAMDKRVDESQVYDGPYSSAAPERQTYSELDGKQVKRTPSFTLNADGALKPEADSAQNARNASHQRISSFEERSPRGSPSSASPSPVFSSFPSSPVFASSPSSPPSSISSCPELRLVLLGRSAAGKSRAGNAILGQEVFESHPESLTAITQRCEKKKALVDGRNVAVVDTPDWFNSEKTPEEVRAQISSCVTLSSPGPHAFLLCVPLDQPAKTELQALEALGSVFGPEAIQRYTLVLFTYADKLRESGRAGKDSVEAYIAAQQGDLLKLVEKCGDKFHVMEIGGGWKEQRNVLELLEKVDQTVKEAGERCYSSPAFQEAENRLRQRQLEIVKERKGNFFERQAATRQLSSERRTIYPYMQPVAEEEEEATEDEIENTRDEAEMSVRTVNIESLPPVVLSSMSPSLIQSIIERMQSAARNLPKLLADGSVWAGEGAKKVQGSPVWGTVGSGAQNVQKMVTASPVWGKVGAGAGQVSKMVGDRVPKVVVDGSSWVGSGAKAAAASPVWGKVGSGAKLMADGSMRAGAGIGSGAKNLAQSPLWGKVGSGAVSGAKLVAEKSMRVGAGIGAGAKKAAQSPVWGKMGERAKEGAKMVAESSVWEKIGTSAKTVPMVVIAGALLGLVLGVILAGTIGGAVGAATGSAVTEVGRRKFGNKSTLEKASEDAKKVETSVKGNVDALMKRGEKVLKTE